MDKIIIAAVAKNGVIGRSTGEMPWYSKEDFQHFKKTTLGFPIIMGRKTFESLKKPLKGRLNIVITQDQNYKIKLKSLRVFNSLIKAYEFCELKKNKKVFIIGGGQIFRKAINNADKMIISHMNFEAEGNIFFPKIDLRKWEVVSRIGKKDFEIVTYSRII
ncbi:MAG: dihydrofolate reductase [Ignavibacteriaceae bacterium]|nr:dihydrofolate reductase [Ignavibacteriaceae bacterium]